MAVSADPPIPALRPITKVYTAALGAAALSALLTGLSVSSRPSGAEGLAVLGLIVVVATLLVGAAMYVVNTIAVAGVICFQDRVPLLDIWIEIALRSSRAERLVYLAQLGIGLLGAVIADNAPWALILFLLPAIAIYLTLDQHVEMRQVVNRTGLTMKSPAHLHEGHIEGAAVVGHKKRRFAQRPSE